MSSLAKKIKSDQKILEGRHTNMNWQILSKNSRDIVKTLLRNRGIKTGKQEKEFFSPTSPLEISLKEIGVNGKQVDRAIERIKKAKKGGEHVVVYGDYDADGISGTATLWETLHEAGLNVLPHIPDRFSEGYGLNLESVKGLKNKNPKLSLIITVDHGITAGKKIEEVKKIGVDMIISDHHQMDKTKPNPLALIYTTKIGGSALAWFFAREIAKKLRLKFDIQERLQLAAIGTVADQLALVEVNRSIVKYGLEELNKTKRPGLKALIEEAGIKNEIGTYEIGFIIAPRINSMGRLKHGIESLRLLCTQVPLKAREIASHIGRTNYERQRIVEDVVLRARNSFKDVTNQSVIILADEAYHEGVIGLAAARLVEEFYRPAIVLSKKGEIAKASARSISGFNIIEAIRRFENLYLEGGGHPMAAGFSIETSKIEKFSKKINSYAKGVLNQDILSRKLRVDMEISLDRINNDLVEKLKNFEPTGLGNPSPSFLSSKVEIIDARRVGRDLKHLKLRLRQNGYIFDSIFFGGGENYSKISADTIASIAYRIEENEWNGRTNLQLVIKDMKI